LAEQDEKQVLLEFLKILKSEIHAARISPDEMRSVLSEIDAGEDPSEEEM
jgi:RNA polymerase-interacting CarD/CdnL/TRCF family regulator